MKLPGKLPGFYDSLVSLNGEQFIKPRQHKQQHTVDEDDSKWRPYWERGQTSIEEFIEAAEPRVQTKTAPVSKKKRRTKLHHSTLDLSYTGLVKKRVKMSKSVSMQGLHTGQHHDPHRRDLRRSMGRVSHRSSSLNLPRLEPDVDFSGESKSRGSSATTAVKSSSNERRRSAFGEDSDSNSDDSYEDIYVSDEDPEISRLNLDKAGDYIVDHDWILQEKMADEARKVQAFHKQVQIVLPDEDPLEPIKTRVDEISKMVKPKAELGNFIDTIDPEQRAMILKYKDLDYTKIRKWRRSQWTPVERFRDAVQKVLLMQRACHPRRRYLSDDKPDTSPDSVKKIKQTSGPEREVVSKSSLTFDVQMSLISQPDYRTVEDVKRVEWMLRATKAFKNLFPAQLEAKLARVVAYERYDNKRVVASQGRDPERFYHVLTGKLIKVREYRLLSGCVTREEGFIEKGNTTDPDEMYNNWPREHHLVTKGNVEVFVIDKHDFLDLLHTSKGPPIDFLQKLDLFKEFPCDEFLQSPDSIDFRYYGQDALVVQDTNRTPWLHVVKTGHVKVVRQQNIIDVQGEDKFSGQATEELGCVRPFSHAKAMLGLLANQRKMKTLVGAISFPEITRRHRPSLVSTQNSEDNSSSPRAPLSKAGPSPRAPAQKKKQKTNIVISSPEETGSGSAGDKSVKSLSDIHEGSEHSTDSTAHLSDPSKLAMTSPRLRSPPLQNGDHTSGSKDSSRRQSADKSVTLPPINTKRSGEFVPHGTYLTRERTETDSVYNNKHQKKDVIQRRTYLQLDVLKPGDIFGLNDVAVQFRSMHPLHDKYGGLEHLEPQALASEAPGVSLVSDGAEIIKISKRFFLQHAQNNTMLKVETMQREYMDSEEARSKMYDKETWRQYKTVLLQRTVDGLHRNQIEKVP